MNLVEKILGNEEHFPLEDRVLNAVLFFSAVVALLSLASNIAQNLGSHTYLYPLFIFLLQLVLYILGRRNASLKKILIPFYIGAFLTVAWIWYAFEGISGSVVLFTMTYIIVTPIITKGVLRNLLVLFLIIEISVLAWVHNNHPEIALPYVSEQMKIIDIVVSGMYMAVAIAMVIHLIINSYQEQREKIEELNRSKGQFMSVIAHDVKGSISGLVGMAEILDRTGPGQEEARKKLEHLMLEASKMSFDLLENLLKWARSESGIMQPRPTTVPLKEMVETNRLLMNDQILNKKISFKENIDPELKALADLNMSDTIIRNLLSNAIKFTREDGKIEVTGTPVPGKKMVALSVSDNGVGMDRDTMDQIFDIQVKISKEGTHHERGTGLGLKLCKEFVNKNGGNIEVDSEEGKGSVFTIYLPSVPGK